MVNDVRTELFHSGQYNDITTDVRQDPPITMTWGRKDEASKVSPSKLTLTLENGDGKYSPRNPESPLFGKLQQGNKIRSRLGIKSAALELPGRPHSHVSTPDDASHSTSDDLDIRIEIDPETWRFDDFVVLAADWRDEPALSGEASWILHLLADGRLELSWSPDGTTGSRVVEPSTESVPIGDELAVRVTLDVDNGAGGYEVTYRTASSIDGTWTQLGDVITGASTTSLFASNQPLTIGAVGDGELAFGNAGQYFKGEVRAFELRVGLGASTLVADPDFTTLDAGDTSLTDSQGNVWSLNEAAAIVDSSIRLAAEVSSLPPDWDLSETDARVPVEASGIRRRLVQGEKALRSSLFRDLSRKTNIPMYWSLEGGQDTKVFTAATGGGSLRIFGEVSPGANSDFVASDSIPEFNVGNVRGYVSSYEPELEQRLSFIIQVPEGGVAAESHLLETVMSGSAHQWVIKIDVNGNLALDINDIDGNLLQSHGFTNFELNGKQGLVFLEWTQNGSDIDWRIGFNQIGSELIGTTGDTLLGHDFGSMTWVRLGTYFVDLNGTAAGHLHLANGNIDSGFWDTIFTSLKAWDGERAEDRIIRLAIEEDIPIRIDAPTHDAVNSTKPDSIRTARMGAQRIDTLTNLLDEAAAVDMGILLDDRDAVRLYYRARPALYNRDVSLTLDYKSGEVATKLRPVEDDQLIRNDVTVERPNGGSFRAIKQTGPKSIARVGLYDIAPKVNVETDFQLEDQANWRLHLGTVDEPRYPQVAVDLTATPGKAGAATAAFAGDRIQVANPPKVGGAPDTIDQLVQGGTEKLTPYRHTIAYNCAPASPWNVVKVGTTKVDTAGSEIDAAESSLTETETEIKVLTTVGERWTTDSSEFPFNIMIAGEEMRVTAISDVTGEDYQSFTVERSVNGVVKAHEVGESVQLAPQHRAVIGF